MKVARLFLLLSVLLSGRESYAQTKFNGNWWSQNDRAGKVMFVIGFWEGEVEESDNWSISLGMAVPEKNFKDMLEFLMVGTKKAAERVNQTKDMNAGQMVDGIDTYYKDFRNRTIPVRAIMRVVKWSVNGKDDAAIEKFLVVLRKSASEAAAK